MIKKGFFILASLIIIGCSSKSNDRKQSSLQSENKAEVLNKSELSTNLFLKQDTIVISEALTQLPNEEMNFRISSNKESIYLDNSNFGAPHYKVLYNNVRTIEGDFYINIKKIFPNKIIFTYSGQFFINHKIDETNDTSPAIVDCSDKTVQEVTFNVKGKKPINTEIKENGCKVSGHFLLPLIHKFSFSDKYFIMEKIYSYEYEKNIDPKFRPLLPKKQQTIYLESY